MSHSPITVANHLIRLAHRDGDEMTLLRLLKLVYIAHGWSYGLRDKPLTSLPVEAWQYGPVYPEVYHHWKNDGPHRALKTKAKHIFFGSAKSKSFREDDAIFVEYVWNRYKKYTAPELVGLTHRDDTPWAITYRNNPGVKGLRIPEHLIKAHYKFKAEKLKISE